MLFRYLDMDFCESPVATKPVLVAAKQFATTPITVQPQVIDAEVIAPPIFRSEVPPEDIECIDS